MYSDHEHLAPSKDAPCEEIMYRRDGTSYQCKAPWTSVLHPPDQYRHWCSALESGYDCMHSEMEDYT